MGRRTSALLLFIRICLSKRLSSLAQTKTSILLKPVRLLMTKSLAELGNQTEIVHPDEFSAHNKKLRQSGFICFVLPLQYRNKNRVVQLQGTFKDLVQLPDHFGAD